MAAPLTDAEYLAISQAAAKTAGVSIYQSPDWKQWNRDGGGRQWGPINYLGLHHTGSDPSSGKSYQLGTLHNGVVAPFDTQGVSIPVPGPLCNWTIWADGTIGLVSNGRANHAGIGSVAVLNHAIAEDYTGNLTPTTPTTDFNARGYGVEVQYSGSHDWTAAQQRAVVALSAAFVKHYGWTERSVIGHGEWQGPPVGGKWDPGIRSGVLRDMSKVRDMIRAALTGSTITTNPGIPSTPTQEDDMPDPKDLWEWDGIPAPSTSDTKTNPAWTPSSYAQLTYANARAGRIAAEQALALAKANAQKSGISDADIATIVNGVADKLGDGFDVNLTPKDS